MVIAVVLLLVLIAAVLIFGPWIAGVFALAVAILGSAAAACVLALAIFVALAFGVGVLFWCGWWVVNPRAAEAALSQAEAERRQRR